MFPTEDQARKRMRIEMAHHQALADWAREVLGPDAPTRSSSDLVPSRGKGYSAEYLAQLSADADEDMPSFIEHREHLAVIRANIRPFTLDDTDFYLTYRRIRHNVALIKELTPFASLQKLRAYEPTGRERFAGRLPIIAMADRPESAKHAKNDMLCKACSLPLTDAYVPTGVCTITKYHPECAAVLVQIVGRQGVFKCMGRLSQHSFNEHAPKPAEMPDPDELDYRLKERIKHLSCNNNNDWAEHYELKDEDAAVWKLLLED